MDHVLVSSGNDEWRTPPYLFHRLNREFGPFTVDAAAAVGNALVDRFWCRQEDGSRQNWSGERIWCNPPYSTPAQGRFIQRAAMCDAEVAVLLIPARTDTRAWHDAVMAHATEIRLVRGRLRFSGADPAPFPSAVAIFEKRPTAHPVRVVSWRVEPGLMVGARVIAGDRSPDACLAARLDMDITVEGEPAGRIPRPPLDIAARSR